MPEFWDVIKPDGTPLVTNGRSRRVALVRAMIYPEMPGEVVGALQDADESTPAGDPIAHEGWTIRRAPSPGMSGPQAMSFPGPDGTTVTLETF